MSDIKSKIEPGATDAVEFIASINKIYAVVGVQIKINLNFRTSHQQPCLDKFSQPVLLVIE